MRCTDLNANDFVIKSLGNENRMASNLTAQDTWIDEAEKEKGINVPSLPRINFNNTIVNDLPLIGTPIDR